MIKGLMEGKMASIMSMHSSVVDVRDTATAHILAIKNPIAANRRFILCQSTQSFQDVVAPIIAKYRPLGWPITENMADPNPNEDIARFDNSASLELGVVYRDIN